MTDLPDGKARRRLPTADWRRTARWVKWIGLVLLAAVLLYYPVGMFVVHRIDDDQTFHIPPASLPEGGSRAVAMAAALIEREVDDNRWVANDPWFFPGAALDNMPNYQQGMVGAVARFAFELVDQIGRARGSSQTDPDLQEASGQLQYSGTIWLFDLSTSWAPTTPSEQRYRKAYGSLRAYNSRLAEGRAVFERRADNLQATLDRIALDLGASSAAIEDHIDRYASGYFDTRADDLFYGIKGQLYAYTLVLSELANDFANVLAERELGKIWGELQDSMSRAAALDPWVVVNAAPDGQFGPSHLAAQGFYLMRARTRLREITNILQK